MLSPRERLHRLPPERYRGERIVAFTTRLLDHCELFREARRTDDFASVLIEEAQAHGCDLVISCFMPDHVHALIQGRREDANALNAFYRFKLRTGVQLDRFCRPAHWQKDFYDHIVRCDGDWRRQARYVVHNPVRAGLVEDPYDHPFNYSSLGSREELLSQIFWDG